MAYEIHIYPEAVEQLSKIPANYRKKLDKKIQKLSDNPFPHNSKEIKEKPGYYRVRFNEYRIIYTVKKEKLLVLVVRVGNRKEIYNALETLPDIEKILVKLMLE